MRNVAPDPMMLPSGITSMSSSTPLESFVRIHPPTFTSPVPVLVSSIHSSAVERSVSLQAEGTSRYASKRIAPMSMPDARIKGGDCNFEKHQIPSIKFQRNLKFQMPTSNYHHLEFGAWVFFGAWCLGFGILGSFCAITSM